MSENTSEENIRLRRTMRDLVALSTLPAIWVGLGPDGIAQSLADVLLSTLSLDLIYVQLAGLTGKGLVEVVRTKRRADAANVEKVRSSLSAVLISDGIQSPIMIPDPFGEGSLHVAVTRFGVGDGRGVLITGSQRADFPAEGDRLLLGVGANQTAIVLQRQRAVEEMNEQRDWLHVTLASIGDAVLTTDNDGRVTFLNTVAESLTGWTQNEAAGQPLDIVFKIIHEQTRHTAENPVAKVLRERHIVGLANHTILIAKDGTETPIDDSAAPIRDEQGRVHGVVLVFRDIVERKRSDDALRRSEQELAEFFENATVGLHWVGPDGIILRVNRAELEMLGYSREEYLGRHIADFHADEDVICDILTRLNAGEKLQNYPARLRHKDGTIKEVLIDSSVLWKDGQFVHTRCFTRDVTDRRREEETQARLAAIVEPSEDAIISKTLDGRILSWNIGAERLFGYNAREVIGESITILIPHERLDEEKAILERLRRGERIEHYETVRLSKQRQRLEVALTISPIRDSTGRLVGASKIARDITARKQSEQTAHFLAGASATLSELTDYESTLQKVASLAVPQFADWCAVDIAESDGSIRRLAVSHADPEKVRFVQELDRKYPTLITDPSGPGKAVRTGEVEWAASIPDEPLAALAKNDERFRRIRQLKLKSYILIFRTLTNASTRDDMPRLRPVTAAETVDVCEGAEPAWESRGVEGSLAVVA